MSRSPPSSGPSQVAAPPHAEADPAAEDVLLLRAQAGEEAAFAQLLEQMRPRLRRLLGGMGGHNAAELDEWLQETSLQLYRALPRYRDQGRGPSVARAWIYRLAVNVALMQQRRARRRPPLALGEGFALAADAALAQAPAPAGAPRPDEGASLREIGRDVDDAIEGLPDKYRLVLWLADVEGHKHDDVAEVLGITLPTVKARLLRARAVIRQSVGKSRRPKHPLRPSP